MDWKEKLLQWFYKNIYRRSPKWDDCTKASCWSGHGAAIRMMNILSPHFANGVFRDRVKWMLKRGCNTAHVFVANEKDGEGGGYSIYGPTWAWHIDERSCQLFRERIRYLRRKGLAVVVWTLSDDLPSYGREVRANPEQYIKDCAKQGMFDLASTVVCCLEIQDTYGSGDHRGIARLCAAIRKHYKGKVGTHEISNHIAYARHADLVFYQVNPGKPVEWIKSEVRRVKNIVGKPVNMFEMERSEDNVKSAAVLADGIVFGVANW